MAVDRLAIDRPARPAHAHDDLVQRLDGQVRERVRREGVDPQREALVVRRIAEDVVRDHDELSLTGAVAPIADDGAMVGELVARVSGFGPLQPFLDDPEVEEVWINDPSRVFIARRGRHELTNLRLDAAQVNELVERMLKSSGRRIDISTPFVDAMLPEGHRLHVVLEGITRGLHRGQHPQVPAARAPALRPRRAGQPHAAGGAASSRPPCAPASTSSSPAAPRPARRRCSTAWPRRCRAASGSSVPRRSSSCASATPTGSRCRPGRPGSSRPARSCCATWSRRRCGCGPSRILVGEVRAAECLDLLLALNSGLPGMCTLHANSAREALVKMCTLPLLAGENISARFVVPTVATSVDLVVHLGLGADGVRRVNEIVSVPGRVEADVIEVEPIFVRNGAELRRTGGVPRAVERYERVGIDVHALLASDRAGER